MVAPNSFSDTDKIECLSRLRERVRADMLTANSALDDAAIGAMIEDYEDGAFRHCGDDY